MKGPLVFSQAKEVMKVAVYACFSVSLTICKIIKKPLDGFNKIFRKCQKWRKELKIRI